MSVGGREGGGEKERKKKDLSDAKRSAWLLVMPGAEDVSDLGQGKAAFVTVPTVPTGICGRI